MLDSRPVIASAARQSMSVPWQPWIATACGLAMTKRCLGQGGAAIYRFVIGLAKNPGHFLSI